MRYNPPPNWPKPPEGWSPPPGWTPDPAWPPSPPGWEFWVDDGVAAPEKKSDLSRLRHSSDDAEYFGDDRAWSADAEPAPPQVHPSAEPAALPPQSAEVEPKDLSAHHIGRTAIIRWDDEQHYNIGTIVAITADSTAVKVLLAGLETPVSFAREVSGQGSANPRISVWI
ncbi:hypothetical protein ACAG26_12845 [Mycobacterium sp. pUA109]|uniref:hypothetical protein n=1 Tax=Mycobacterium sp. pUA109 TaxID=3238982 RepID=UPI00351AD676